MPTCRKAFNTKHNMMNHRLKDHPDKVRPCRDQDSCTRTTCWYQHEKNKHTEAVVEEDESGIEWLNSELDSEIQGFQEEKTPTKPH